MMGDIIRALWCQTFHWAHRQFVGFGSFYRGDESTGRGAGVGCVVGNGWYQKENDHACKCDGLVVPDADVGGGDLLVCVHAKSGRPLLGKKYRYATKDELDGYWRLRKIESAMAAVTCPGVTNP